MSWSRLQPKQVKIATVLSDVPDTLCFAFPCLLAYFREATNLCCAHEANPCVSFWKAGRVCLVSLPKIFVTKQRRPVPLHSSFVYTPSGSISQQHCITLTGSPHLSERNMIGLLSPVSQIASNPQLLPSHSTLADVSVLLTFRAAFFSVMLSNMTQIVTETD